MGKEDIANQDGITSEMKSALVKTLEDLEITPARMMAIIDELLDVPEQLEKTDNLYNQPPFLSLLDQMHSNFPKYSVEELRHAVTVWATRMTEKNDLPADHKRHLKWRLTVGRGELDLRTRSTLVEELLSYPLAIEYIRKMNEDRVYRSNGEPNAPSMVHRQDLPTYADWMPGAFGKLVFHSLVQKRERLLGLDQISSEMKTKRLETRQQLRESVCQLT